MHNNLTVLNQLLFRMLDSDKVMLGDYLSQRILKVMLKVFIGCFRFGRVQIEKRFCVNILYFYAQCVT